MEHTPGPWTAVIHASGVIYVTSDKVGVRDICDLYHIGPPIVAGATGETFPKDNAEANVRLIAAAPELLEVLKEQCDLIESNPILSSCASSTLEVARKVIAKATGD